MQTIGMTIVTTRAAPARLLWQLDKTSKKKKRKRQSYIIFYQPL